MNDFSRMLTCQNFILKTKKKKRIKFLPKIEPSEGETLEKLSETVHEAMQNALNQPEPVGKGPNFPLLGAISFWVIFCSCIFLSFQLFWQEIGMFFAFGMPFAFIAKPCVIIFFFLISLFLVLLREKNQQTNEFLIFFRKWNWKIKIDFG